MKRECSFSEDRKARLEVFRNITRHQVDTATSESDRALWLASLSDLDRQIGACNAAIRRERQ